MGWALVAKYAIYNNALLTLTLVGLQVAQSVCNVSCQAIKKLSTSTDKPKVELSTSAGSQLSVVAVSKSGSEATWSKIVGPTLVQPVQMPPMASSSVRPLKPRLISPAAWSQIIGQKLVLPTKPVQMPPVSALSMRLLVPRLMPPPVGSNVAGSIVVRPTKLIPVLPETSSGMRPLVPRLTSPTAGSQVAGPTVVRPTKAVTSEKQKAELLSSVSSKPSAAATGKSTPCYQELLTVGRRQLQVTGFPSSEQEAVLDHLLVSATFPILLPLY